MSHFFVHFLCSGGEGYTLHVKFNPYKNGGGGRKNVHSVLREAGGGGCAKSSDTRHFHCMGSMVRQ